VVVAANDAAPTQWRIPMSKLTDTQLVILSSALRRNDRGVDLPANVTDETVRKAVDKLIRTGLLEEVRANGSLLAWRRDVEAGPMALHITKQGLEAIDVQDAAVAASNETSVGPAPTQGEVTGFLWSICGPFPVSRGVDLRICYGSKNLCGRVSRHYNAATTVRPRSVF